MKNNSANLFVDLIKKAFAIQGMTKRKIETFKQFAESHPLTA